MSRYCVKTVWAQTGPDFRRELELALDGVPRQAIVTVSYSAHQYPDEPERDGLSALIVLEDAAGAFGGGPDESGPAPT